MDILEDKYHQQALHKNTEAGVLSIILQLLPSNFTIEHMKGHQNYKIKYNDLDIKAQINIDVNSIASSTSTIPIDTHVIALPFEMYTDHKYTHHRPNYYIRDDSHKHESQLFLQNKYTWHSKICHSINYDSHDSCLLSISDSLK